MNRRPKFPKAVSIDALQHPDAEQVYSWWDYRMLGFQKNRGLRIDHILVSRPLIDKVTDAGIDYELRGMEKPSDHAPVWTELAL